MNLWTKAGRCIAINLRRKLLGLAVACGHESWERGRGWRRLRTNRRDWRSESEWDERWWVANFDVRSASFHVLYFTFYQILPDTKIIIQWSASTMVLSLVRRIIIEEDRRSFSAKLESVDCWTTNNKQQQMKIVIFCFSVSIINHQSPLFIHHPSFIIDYL